MGRKGCGKSAGIRDVAGGGNISAAFRYRGDSGVEGVTGICGDGDVGVFVLIDVKVCAA